MKHNFFKALDVQVKRWLQDPRREDEVRYPFKHVFYLGMVLFLGALYSCRALEEELEETAFKKGFRRLLGEDCDEICTTGNMTKGVWKRLDPHGLVEVCAWMSKQVILSKSLHRFRLNGLFMVAVDGTVLFERRQRHCQFCLSYRHADGSTSYRHYALVARLVTPIGLTLPLAVEFIENGDVDLQQGSEDARKQDCELKAFGRLAAGLKKLFPRLPICITGDALYANRTAMKICRDNHWSYTLRFKSGSLPRLHSEALAQVKAYPESQKVRQAVRARKRYRQSVQWCEGLHHEGHLCHALFYQETRKGTNYDGAWLLSPDLRPSQLDPFHIAASARLRWKIENEGFNTGKNGACNLKHSYGRIGNSWKNYFLLAQIAQLFHDLIRLSDVVDKLTAAAGASARRTFTQVFGSVTRFARRLFHSMCASTTEASDGLLERTDGMQLRFRTA